MKSEIICIIDRSGSMGPIANDAIGGFNTFLEEQKKIEGDAALTFVQFDNVYDVVYENTPLQDVPPLTHDTYVPRGSTALLDAIGRTIDDMGRRLSNLPAEARPDKVIVAILTDGEENASNIFTLATVKEKIEHQRSVYSWEFIFLAANQDAFAESFKLGIDSADTFSFQATRGGVRDAYASMSKTVAGYRT